MTTSSTQSTTWPGAFGVFKPSMRIVLFNIWLYLALALFIPFAASLLIGIVDGVLDLPKAVSLVLNVASNLIAFILGIASVLVLLAASKEERLDIKTAWSQALSKTLPMIGVSILVALIAIVSLLALVIPFFFIFPRVVLAPYYVLDANLGVIEAIKQSWSQSKGNVAKLYGIFGANIAMILPAFTIIGIPVTIFLLFAYSAADIILYRFIVDGSFNTLDEAKVV